MRARFSSAAALVALAALAGAAAHAGEGSIPTETARPAEGLAISLVRIPAATFTMGTERDESDRSMPHQVTLSPFWIMTHEVTQEQYHRVIRRTPSHFAGHDDRPVEKVSWYHAVIFCNKLSALDGRDSCYVRVEGDYRLDASRNGYRLPTEAEWEYACGRHDRPGKDIARVGWYAVNAGLETQPVKALEANAFGTYDMLGNVWEWCSDWYEPYGAEAAVDPVGPGRGEAKVVRGGGWWNVAAELDARHRSFTRPDYRFSFLGFRCVRSGGTE